MFKCDSCGLCCKAVNCQYLTEDNKCSIYDKRPDICNIDKGYEMYFKASMSKQEWYEINYKACSDMKQQQYARKEENK